MSEPSSNDFKQIFDLWFVFWGFFLFKSLGHCLNLYQLKHITTKTSKGLFEINSPGFSPSICNVKIIDMHRLIGLVVKASASRAEDPGLKSRLRRDFGGIESYQLLQNLRSSGYPARRLAL